jgi:hypothetical protein
MDTENVITNALHIAAAQYGQDAKACKADAPSIAEQFERQRRAALAIADLIEGRGLAALPNRVNV